jgi:hypothetical protein
MISIIPKDSDAVIEQKRRFAEQVDRDNAHLPIYLITGEDFDFDKCFAFVRCDRTVIDAIGGNAELGQNSTLSPELSTRNNFRAWF